MQFFEGNVELHRGYIHWGVAGKQKFGKSVNMGIQKIYEVVADRVTWNKSAKRHEAWKTEHTPRGSSLALASHSRRTSGKLPSKSEAISLVACF